MIEIPVVLMYQVDNKNHITGDDKPDDSAILQLEINQAPKLVYNGNPSIWDIRQINTFYWTAIERTTQITIDAQDYSSLLETIVNILAAKYGPVSA